MKGDKRESIQTQNTNKQTHRQTNKLQSGTRRKYRGTKTIKKILSFLVCMKDEEREGERKENTGGRIVDQKVKQACEREEMGREDEKKMGRKRDGKARSKGERSEVVR